MKYPVPTREEFLYIGDNGKHVFYVLTYLSLAIAAYQILLRAKIWYKGRPLPGHRDGWNAYIPTGSALRVWIKNIGLYVLAQKKVRSSRQKNAAPMHLFIFYGFLALTIGTTLLAINTYSPIKFHYGLYYLIYEMTLDIMGTAFVIGVGWALMRRIISNRSIGRRPLSHKVADYWALALLLIVAVTGFWLEASRMSVNPQPFDWSSPVGHLWSQAQGPLSPAAYRLIWWFHMGWIWVFFATLPQLKLKHIVIAVMSAAGKPDTPMGRLAPLTIEEVEQTGKIGASEAFDFNRWQLMSWDACMECGRCTEVCPAWGVGKVLDPQRIVQNARVAELTGQALPLALNEEALWACTTCNACVEACPVLIRQVDVIVDVRRALVADNKLSGSGATMLRQTASTGNPWGSPSSTREDWMKDLQVPLCRDGAEFDVLLWVGCAGATDPSAIQTTKALVELLTKAGVKFACLGREETCTGDGARRLGDEFLFQEKAAANIATFQKYGVKKVVTPCPHCFNTLKNEYPDFGADLDVSHHSQLLADLAGKGLLKSAAVGPEVAFHDPCYLARVNEESAAPRAVLGSPAEPVHSKSKTLCCGAGGGRMWMDESPDQRPAVRRMTELLETGATTIGVGCPFCKIMLETGAPNDAEKPVRLVDLAILMREAN